MTSVELYTATYPMLEDPKHNMADMVLFAEAYHKAKSEGINAKELILRTHAIAVKGNSYRAKDGTIKPTIPRLIDGIWHNLIPRYDV